MYKKRGKIKATYQLKTPCQKKNGIKNWGCNEKKSPANGKIFFWGHLIVFSVSLFS